MLSNTKCGVIDPRHPNSGGGCQLDAGHPGKHYAGSFWYEAAAPKAKAQPAAKKPDPKAKSAEKSAEKKPTPTTLVKAGYCGAPFDGLKKKTMCTLVQGHDGPHENTSTGAREDWATPRPAPDASPAPADATPPPMVALDSLEQIGKFYVHPAASIFRLITEVEWEKFVEDIRTNGQRTPIVTVIYQDASVILDGRNRLRACLQLGITPKFRAFGSEPTDGSDQIAFVVSENLNGRRNLDETDRAFIGAELVPMYEQQARERQRLGGEGKGRANLPEAQLGRARDHAALAVRVSPRSIEAALKVKRDAAPEVLAAARDQRRMKVSAAADLTKLPKKQQIEIIEKIGSGEIRSGKVRTYVAQEQKRATVRKVNSGQVPPMPIGPFGVIYGDYPWHYDNSDQHEGSRGHLGYPTMTLDEIVAHAIEASKRAAENCVLVLWTTNLYVTRLDRVIAAYGAEHRSVWTWPKPRAGIGTWGRGQTEHLVIASIGDPIHTLNEVSTLLPSWKPEHQGEHSSKPAEVAELLRKHCSGPFLELFARGPREGFVAWGAEVDKFATEAA